MQEYYGLCMYNHKYFPAYNLKNIALDEYASKEKLVWGCRDSLCV